MVTALLQQLKLGKKVINAKRDVQNRVGCETRRREDQISQASKIDMNEGRWRFVEKMFYSRLGPEEYQDKMLTGRTRPVATVAVWVPMSL